MTDLLDNDIIAIITIPQVQKARGKIKHVKWRHGTQKNNSKFLKMKIAMAKMRKYSERD